MSFFQGVMPHLNRFDDNDILQFLMGVLEVFANINEKKKAAQSQPYLYHQQQLSAHTFSPIPPQLSSLCSKFISQSPYTRNNRVFISHKPNTPSQEQTVSPLHSTSYSSATTSLDGYSMDYSLLTQFGSLENTTNLTLYWFTFFIIL